MSRAGLVASRLAFAATSLTAVLYALVTLVPFTYREIVQAQLLPPVTAFARFHPFLNLAASAPLLLMLRREARGFCAVLAALALGLLAFPILPALRGGWPSAAAAGASLAPLLWLAAIDLRAGLRERSWDRGTDPSHVFAACLGAALAAIAGFGAAAVLRLADAAAPRELVAAMLWSATLHLVAALGVFVLLTCAIVLARGRARPAQAELWLGGGVLALAGGLFLSGVAFPAASFTGPGADVAAAGLSGAATAALMGLASRLRESGEGGLESLLSPLTPSAAGGGWGKAAWTCALALAAGGVAARAATLDWDFVVQRFVAAAAWLLLLAALLARRPAPGNPSEPAVPYRWLAVALLGLAAQRGLEASREYWPALVGDPEFRVGRALDRWSGLDPSFRLLRDALGRGAAREGSAFYQLLGRHTNLPRSLPIAPVEIDLGPRRGNSPRPPHLFVFVIDSLRRDYLSPYNPQVDFTPAIAAFAGRSIVMRQAFTAYGGTGLSEPSLWAGARLLHKQYVTPFSPMNVLEKLVRSEGYAPYLSVDTILQAILDPGWPVEALDRRVLNRDYDLCGTLEELQEKLEGRDDARPLFVFSQPQNLHVAQIASQGRSVLGRSRFPGFDAPYASRLERLDSCFGRFLDHLDRSGMLADSIVVLTADHGDSLGEQGRWGHAYTLYPEVVRVPLIIHLPDRLREGRTWDPEAIALLIDVVPSLAELLGYSPPSPATLSGRSLFGPEARPPTVPGDEQLLASSYGPVYGLLWDAGRRLFVADGVNYIDSLYVRGDDDRFVERPVTPELRERARQRIAERVEAIGAFYGFEP
jgi:hypothetical protein